MPREGVPYPERLLCSVRCELKNIWNALSGKLHSVNGVEGDGQGNVDIVSGDAAVVVTPQPLSNQVEISLDQSQLPSAAVTSVNGQTGAVVLDGTDIKTAVYGPNNTATQDIATARTAIQSVSQNVTAEATARQNADSALQTNINNVTASLPGAAAAAVAADPTIASLVAADSQNVKLSGNQSIGGIKTVSTEVTGTYSSQIANSSKVKNELDSFAQYCILTTGNQSKSGILDFNTPPLLVNGGGGVRLNTAAQYQKFGLIDNTNDGSYVVSVALMERGGFFFVSLGITVSGGVVTVVSANGRTIYGSSTRVFMGAAMTLDGIEIFCHSDTNNRFFSPSIFGCFIGAGLKQPILPKSETVSVPTGYVEAAFTEAP